MIGAYHTWLTFHLAVKEKGFASFDELINFFKHRLPTAACLIERTADNLINFQTAVEKRFSKFKLLKCCVIFQQRSQTDFVSNQRAQVLQRISFSLQNEVLFSRALPYSTLGMPIFRHLALTESTISACTVVVKRSSIQSDIIPNSETRRE